MKQRIRFITIWCATLLFLQIPLNVSAQSKEAADEAYGREQYDSAIVIYQHLLEQGASASVYYNLGNCYYKKGEIARAVLNYERAARLAPRDADVRFNLELARSKTVDKITPESEMFFVTWYRALVSSMRADEWGRLAVGAFCLMLISVGIYLFATRMAFKKSGFFVALLMLLATALTNIFAYQQRQFALRQTNAIVMTSPVVVRSTPNDSGTELFVLHEGTHVTIVDNSMKEWCEIRLADGKQGWMRREQMETI